MEKYYHDRKIYDEAEMNRIVMKRIAHPAPRTLKTLEMLEGKQILDLGCGTGDVSYLAAKKVFPYGNVIGIDFLEDSIRIASKRFKNDNLQFKVGDIDKSDFSPSSYDCVLFLEVIEHIDNPTLTLKKIHQILKPNGHLIVSTPNGASLDTFFQNLKPIKKTIEGIEKETPGSGTETDHLYAWPLPILYRLLHRGGFAYVKHAFAGAGFPFTNLDRALGTDLSNLFGPLFGRFGTGIILKVKKI